MAKPYEGNGYKIWLNNKKTKKRITEENILVGNRRGDGKSKVTSGVTGAGNAYVIFKTWDDLLDAAGVLERLTIKCSFSQENCGECFNPTPVDVTVSTNLSQENCEECFDPTVVDVVINANLGQSGCEDVVPIDIIGEFVDGTTDINVEATFEDGAQDIQVEAIFEEGGQDIAVEASFEEGNREIGVEAEITEGT